MLSLFIIVVAARPDGRAPAVRRPHPDRPGDALDRAGPRRRPAHGRQHQPDDRDHVLHRLGARGRRRRESTASTSATPGSTSGSRPASRRSRRPSSAASATPSARPSAASSSASSRSARPSPATTLGPGDRVRRRSSSSSSSARRASSASRRRNAHDAPSTRSRRGARARARASASGSSDATTGRRRSSSCMAIIGLLLPLFAGLPLVRDFQPQAAWIDGFSNAGRLRPPGRRPQPRRRRGRPARPRLRGVLRDRLVRLRVRGVAVREPDPRDQPPGVLGDLLASSSGRCCSSARCVAALFGVLLGAPTLRLRGDYLAIVTLGFGEIVPIVFREAATVHERHQRHRRHLPAVAARHRRLHRARRRSPTTSRPWSSSRSC